jgi:hypothetical protein
MPASRSRIALPGSLGGGSPYRVVQDGERLIALEQVHGPTLAGSGRPAVRENGPGRSRSSVDRQRTRCRVHGEPGHAA